MNEFFFSFVNYTADYELKEAVIKQVLAPRLALLYALLFEDRSVHFIGIIDIKILCTTFVWTVSKQTPSEK